MRKLLLAGAAIGALMVSSGTAQSDFIFSRGQADSSTPQQASDGPTV
jgi:hypothetical protein